MRPTPAFPEGPQAHHDGVVRDLISPTPDGSLRSLLEVKLGPDHHRVSAMSATQGTAHQAASIYLWVKRHPAEEQPGVLTELDPELEPYYDVLADVLDEVAGSSPLQRLLGASSTIVAFSSQYAGRFLDDLAAGGDLSPLPLEQPDTRLQGVLDALTDATVALDDLLSGRLALVCARVGLAPWDLHDEHAWQRHQATNPEALDVVASELALAIRPWLIEASGLPFLANGDFGPVLKRLEAWAGPPRLTEVLR